MSHTAGFLRIVAVCVAAGLCGCSGKSARPVLQDEIPISWQKSGTYSHLSRCVRIVARDQATLAQIPVTEVPVDFQREMVLIVGLGPTPSSELGIQITRIWSDGARLHAQEIQTHPGTEQQAGLRPASPWSVAVVPRSDLNVEGYSVFVPRDLISPGGFGSGTSAASAGTQRSGRPR